MASPLPASRYASIFSSNRSFRRAFSPDERGRAIAFAVARMSCVRILSCSIVFFRRVSQPDEMSRSTLRGILPSGAIFRGYVPFTTVRIVIRKEPARRRRYATHSLIAVMKNVRTDVGPEFIPGIAADLARKSQADPISCMRAIGLAVGAPRVRKKIASADGQIARIGGREMPVAAPRHEPLLDHAAEPPAERLLRLALVAWILSPYRAESDFHRVAGGDSASGACRTARRIHPSVDRIRADDRGQCRWPPKKAPRTETLRYSVDFASHSQTLLAGNRLVGILRTSRARVRRRRQGIRIRAARVARLGLRRQGARRSNWLPLPQRPARERSSLRQTPAPRSAPPHRRPLEQTLASSSSPLVSGKFGPKTWAKEYQFSRSSGISSFWRPLAPSGAPRSDVACICRGTACRARRRSLARCRPHPPIISRHRSRGVRRLAAAVCRTGLPGRAAPIRKRCGFGRGKPRPKAAGASSRTPHTTEASRSGAIHPLLRS